MRENVTQTEQVVRTDAAVAEKRVKNIINVD